MRLNYYVRTGRLQNPRKGLYCKPNYNPQELACRIFTPSYLSLEYVLQRSGVIFQYDSRFTALSYLSRDVEIENQVFSFRIISVKHHPEYGEELREKYTDIIPGYYLNKIHWSSVFLSGNVPEAVLKQMLDGSYE